MSVHNAVTSNKSSDIADTAASNGFILYLLTLMCDIHHYNQHYIEILYYG